MSTLISRHPQLCVACLAGAHLEAKLGGTFDFFYK